MSYRLQIKHEALLNIQNSINQAQFKYKVEEEIEYETITEFACRHFGHECIWVSSSKSYKSYELDVDKIKELDEKSKDLLMNKYLEEGKRLKRIVFFNDIIEIRLNESHCEIIHE